MKHLSRSSFVRSFALKHTHRHSFHPFTHIYTYIYIFIRLFTRINHPLYINHSSNDCVDSLTRIQSHIICTRHTRDFTHRSSACHDTFFKCLNNINKHVLVSCKPLLSLLIDHKILRPFRWVTSCLFIFFSCHASSTQHKAYSLPISIVTSYSFPFPCFFYLYLSMQLHMI